MLIEVFRSTVIGAVQGVSEFLPISSSGHLVLIPYIFHWDYQGLNFDIALHFGTAIALVAFFWREWISIFRRAFSRNQQSSKSDTSYPSNLLWQIVLASIPVGIAGVLLDKFIEAKFHSPLLIVFNLAFFGIILWLVDKYSKSTTKLSAITYKRTFWIGISQAIALFPGVSRSGITISAARLAGLPKKEAASFSFLLATPAIFGAFIFAAKDLHFGSLGLPFWIGTLASTIFGLLAIKFLLKYLERGSFTIFVWYRIIIAAIVLFLHFK